MKLSDIHIAYHRNGISGEGFHVATFKMTEFGCTRNMTAVVFAGQGRCAVLDVDELQKGNIGFAEGNSWRGDHFEAELAQAIEKFRNQ